MPVLPLVGSMIIVSDRILPSRSAASIIARPMRSLTLQSGLKFSSFAAIVACSATAIRLSCTKRRAANALSDVFVNVGCHVDVMKISWLMPKA